MINCCFCLRLPVFSHPQHHTPSFGPSLAGSPPSCADCLRLNLMLHGTECSSPQRVLKALTCSASSPFEVLPETVVQNVRTVEFGTSLRSKIEKPPAYNANVRRQIMSAIVSDCLRVIFPKLNPESGLLAHAAAAATRLFCCHDALPLPWLHLRVKGRRQQMVKSLPMQGREYPGTSSKNHRTLTAERTKQSWIPCACRQTQRIPAEGGNP